LSLPWAAGSVETSERGAFLVRHELRVPDCTAAMDFYVNVFAAKVLHLECFPGWVIEVELAIGDHLVLLSPGVAQRHGFGYPGETLEPVLEVAPGALNALLMRAVRAGGRITFVKPRSSERARFDTFITDIAGHRWWIDTSSGTVSQKGVPAPECGGVTDPVDAASRED
jgi:uncharacterized glyoxalase superfamily protein PhnB